MNPSLVQELLEEKSPTLRILYGVATGANTVLVAGSTVAVVLPALSPVVNGDYVAVLATGADRLILGAVGGGGRTVGYAQVVANQGSISTTLINVTGLTVTFTAVTGRRYRTSCYFNMIGNTANDIGEVLITDPVPTQLSAAVPPPINTTFAWSSGCSVIETGLSGSVTRKLMVRRIGGSGLLQLNASAIIPAYILVEDIGPA